MRTALDTSVILLLRRRQSGWELWRKALDRASREGSLLICPIVFAECSPGFSSAREVLDDLALIEVRFDPILPDAAFMAGQVHLAYRREGGPRQHLLPDFLIAAHAQTQADRMAAIDRGYLRRYFPQLRLLEAT